MNNKLEEQGNIKLSEVFDHIIGGGTPPRDNTSYWSNGDIPWCTVKDFKNSTILNSTQEYISQCGLENSSAKIVPKNSLIIPTRMGVGRIAVNTIDMAINQDLKGCIVNSKFDLNYIKYAYINKSLHIERLASGSTVSGIDLNELKNIKIKNIKLGSQVKIGNLLSTMDNMRRLND